LFSDGPNGHIETPWSKFVYFVETKRLFLLYLSADVKGIVPKRVFKDSSQIDSFRGLVFKRVPLKTDQHQGGAKG
jgi:hypothetical protein